KSFRRAFELDRNDSSAHSDFAMELLLPLGRIEEAVAQARIAERTDPLSLAVQYRLAYTLISDGRFDEATAHCKKPCTREPVSQGRINLLQGRINETIPILEAQFNERLRTDPEWARKGGADELGYAYAVAGRQDEAEKIAALSLRPIEQAAIF